MLCPDGLSATLQLLTRNVLRFAAAQLPSKRLLLEGGGPGSKGAPPGGTGHCEYQCNVSCAQLHGNLQRECGGCGVEMPCHHGAEDFFTWRARQRQWEEAQRVERPQGHAARKQPVRRPREERLTSAEATAPRPLPASIPRSPRHGPAAEGGGGLRPRLQRMAVASPTTAAHGSVSLCDGVKMRAALPVLDRFCRRVARRCAATDAMLRRYFETAAAPAIVHREVGRQGAGFGAVMQEKANLLLLGLATGRRVLYVTDRGAFNTGGALLSPTADAPMLPRARRWRPWESAARAATRGSGSGSASLPNALDGLPADVGFASSEACTSFVASLAQRPSAPRLSSDVTTPLPYRCRSLRAAGEAGRRWLPALEDGMADEFVKAMTKSRVWDRWKHKMLRPLPLHQLFPNSSAVAFNSPSVTLAFANDAVLAAAPHLAPVASGGGEFSGPSCLVRHLTSRVAPSVLRSILSALAPSALTATCTAADAACASGALVLAIHVRRGDKAMMEECRTCVNQEDPDVQPGQPDRISLTQVQQRLLGVNRTVTALRQALGRDVLVFAASDTEQGTQLVRDVFGDAVLTVNGQSVHSTRTRAAGSTDAVKVVADFVALAIADVAVAIGQSSFSGNAFALNLGLATQLGTRARGQVLPHEIEALRASFAPADATDV